MPVKEFKYCPVCGEELETHPNSGMPSCFNDGDVRLMDGDMVVFKLVGGAKFETKKDLLDLYNDIKDELGL